MNPVWSDSWHSVFLGMGRLFPASIQLLFVEQIAGEAHYVIVAPKQQQKVFILHNFRQLLVVDCYL